MIVFEPQDHKYYSPLDPKKDWISVTTLIHGLCEPFQKQERAEKCSTRRPGKYDNKWYGLPVEEILQAWDNENKRSVELGSWYHKMREDTLVEQDIPIYQPVVVDNIKQAPDQKLVPGIYPEHMIYLESAGICGQVDLPSVTKDLVLNINDYKTNKEIKKKGFTNWEGITKKMLGPLSHLDDCELNHYSLQLSLYAFMILRHNPNLTLGKLTIEHVKFEVDGEDKYGYPIARLNDMKEPIVREVEMIEVPYMKNECIKLVEWIKKPDNRIKIIKH
jgi:hypothetical protein